MKAEKLNYSPNCSKHQPTPERWLENLLYGTPMFRRLNNKHASDFEKPDDITSAFVCDDSGLLAVEGYCKDHAHTEYFVKGTEPTSYCPTGLKKKQKADDKKKKEEEEKKRKAAEEAAKNKLNISPGAANKLPAADEDDD